MRLGENLAGNDSVDKGAVYEGLVNHGHILLGQVVEYYRGSIDNSDNSAVNSSSSAVAAIVSSEDITRAAESIRVEGAQGGGRDNNVEQTASALLEGGTGAGHAAAV